MPIDRSHRLALWGIVLLAALPRLLMLGNTESIWHPDEFYFVYKALGFFGGDLNPHLFNYPSLLFYGTALLYACAFALQKLFSSGLPLDQWVLYHHFWHPEELMPLARLLALSFALGTVYLAGRIATQLADARTGLIAALLTALSTIHLRQSPLAAVDLPMCFWVLAALYFSLRLLEERSLKFYLFAGLCTGLAASTKYPGALAGVAVLAAHILAPKNEERAAPNSHEPSSAANPPQSSYPPLATAAYRLLDHRLWLAGLVSLLTFLCTSPYVLLDFATFWHYFARELSHAAGGHGADLGTGWWYHLKISLRYNLGFLGLAGLASGLFFTLKKHTHATWVLLALFAIFYLTTGSSRTVFVRYALPLCILQALFCALALHHLRAYRWSVILLPLLLVEPLYGTYRLVQISQREDTRIQARHWIENNLPEGLTLCNFGGWYGDIPLRTSEQVWWQLWNFENAYAQNSPESDNTTSSPSQSPQGLGYVEQGMARGVAGRSATGSGGGEHARQRPARGEGTRALGHSRSGIPQPIQQNLDFLQKTRPPTPYYSYIIDRGNHPDESGSIQAIGDYDCDCVILHQHPLSYSTIDTTFYAELQKRSHLLKRFTPVGLKTSTPAYDPIDAYYLPIGHFGALSQSGPEIEIWQIKEQLPAAHIRSARALLAQGYAVGASVRLVQNKNAEALAMSHRALALDADNIEARLTRALLYQQKGDVSQAMSQLKELLQIAPQHPSALYNLGTLAAQTNDLNTAANTFTRFIQIRPDHAPAYYELGVIHYRQKHYQQALNISQQGQKIDQQNPGFYYNIALAYSALDRRDQAIATLDKLLLRMPTDANAHFLLGNLYYQQDAHAKTRHHYERLLDLDPSHPRAPGIRRLLQKL